MVEKEELRKKAKDIRNSLDMEKISEKIVKNILKLEIYKKAQHIMIFYPLAHEVNLLGLIKNDPLGKKMFYLPKLECQNLIVCPYKEGDELVESRYKTKEPTTIPIDIRKLDIIFVPALMVDNNLNRLGYGGGFYDKFLASKCIRAAKIVVIPNSLIVDAIPFEAFDIKADIIVCEELLQPLNIDT